MATTDQNCFVVKLRTKLHIGKTILENLTGDTHATIIKQIENYLLFNTSFLVMHQSIETPPPEPWDIAGV